MFDTSVPLVQVTKYLILVLSMPGTGKNGVFLNPYYLEVF